MEMTMCYITWDVFDNGTNDDLLVARIQDIMEELSGKDCCKRMMPNSMLIFMPKGVEFTLAKLLNSLSSKLYIREVNVFNMQQNEKIKDLKQTVFDINKRLEPKPQKDSYKLVCIGVPNDKDTAFSLSENKNDEAMNKWAKNHFEWLKNN